MISEGSCDTEDLSNGFWKFSFAITGVNCILKYIKLNNILNWDYIWRYYCFYCISDQINAGLVSIK